MIYDIRPITARQLRSRIRGKWWVLAFDHVGLALWRPVLDQLLKECLRGVPDQDYGIGILQATGVGVVLWVAIRQKRLPRCLLEEFTRIDPNSNVYCASASGRLQAELEMFAQGRRKSEENNRNGCLIQALEMVSNPLFGTGRKSGAASQP